MEYYSPKWKETNMTQNNLDESPGNYAQWQKPIPKGNILYGSIYVIIFDMIEYVTEMENRLVIANS